MKVITFSRKFPAHHPRAKQLTFFAEKFWQSMIDNDKTAKAFAPFKAKYRKEFGFTTDGQGWQEPHIAKHHTIRKGHRWKKGDSFSPRVWGENINPKSGKSGPYQSKQITIGPDTEITEVYDFRITKKGEIFLGETEIHLPELRIIARNDGFENSDDLEHWFANVKEFDGQIICWNSKVNYEMPMVKVLGERTLGYSFQSIEPIVNLEGN